MAAEKGLMLLIAVLLTVTVPGVRGHGYMLEPPSRQSAWRVGYGTPTNYNDRQLWCGGRTYQWDVVGGQCGVCGDRFVPTEATRDYEYPDGKNVRGVAPVNKVYRAGQVLTVVIRLTAQHMGYFVFRLCKRDDLDDPDATEECLEQNVLELVDGGTRTSLDLTCNGYYLIKVKLPAGLTCEKCFFQWKYHTGNCGDDCGDNQEEFYACADIVIRSDAPVSDTFADHKATCGTTQSGVTTTTTTPTTTTRPAATTTTTRPTTTTPTTTTTTTTRPTTTTTTRPTTTTTRPTTTTTRATTTTTTTTTTTRTPSTTTTRATTTTTTPTLPSDAELQSRCQGPASSCSVYCRNLSAFCDLIPQCQGCREYFKTHGK